METAGGGGTGADDCLRLHASGNKQSNNSKKRPMPATVTEEGIKASGMQIGVGSTVALNLYCKLWYDMGRINLYRRVL